MTAQTRPDELIRILRAEFVTKSGGVPGGGAGSCVTFTCGAIGWRGEAGIAPRVLIHEAAFQLSSSGNARGNYAIDLQQLRWQATQVAGSYGSAIYSNEDNLIGGAGGADTDNEWSTITGSYNEIYTNASYCHILGSFNTIWENCYDIVALGWSHELHEATYGVYGYDDIIVDDAMLCFSFGEGNELIRTVPLGDYPTYSGSFGTFNIIEGDVWYIFQFGDNHEAHGLSTWGIWIGMQAGYYNYIQDVNQNFLFGSYLKSYMSFNDDFYDGRILLGISGYASNTLDGTGHSGGYNQASWFSQNWVINTWYTTWLTAYQYPIIQESAWGFKAYISETYANCAEIGAWKIEGLIKNAGGVTTLVWSTVTALYRDNANREWKAAADNVNDRLIFQFRDLTGPDAAHDHNTQIRLDTEEVGYDSP